MPTIAFDAVYSTQIKGDCPQLYLHALLTQHLGGINECQATSMCGRRTVLTCSMRVSTVHSSGRSETGSKTDMGECMRRARNAGCRKEVWGQSSLARQRLYQWSLERWPFKLP